ncbi:MAG: CBS domain-containing protein [Desulfovibrionaceae bacterium]|nr:CBS domain-containing protein [Desulfovibrionaceae bacterium]
MSTSPDTLITCHANADFDALAAMIAIRHLYPQAVLLFPGTQENRLKNALDKLDKAKYGFRESQSLNFEHIHKLIIVDTRQPARVPHVAALLAKKDLDIEVWDHHPESSKDFEKATIRSAKTGAVTSFIIKELQERQIKISAEEATLLALGIYEDTGAFTYTSTTAQDFLAAAWLADQGMNIDEIAELEMQHLNGMQIKLLNQLIETSQTYRVGTQDVIVAEIVLEDYIYDCAFLAYQLMEMGKYQVVFVLCQLADRIQVIARSKIESFNVGDICAILGGGGHAYAASASIKNITLPAVKESILRQLHLQHAPAKTVRAYMSTPPIGVPTNTSIRQADEMMFHFGLKSIPVFKPGTHILAGIFDVQTAQRAVNHELSDIPVEEYMQQRVLTITPEADMNEVASIIIHNHQRMVPVIENNEVVGIMTRTDLVNLFADISTTDNRRGAKYYHLEKILRDRLPPWIHQLFDQVAKVAKELQVAVYVVGGFVRDLILAVPNHDIDLVVEGNGETFVEKLAKELNGRVSTHEKFLTAIVIFKDLNGEEQKIDVATARLEYYEHPAALPLVEVSPIKMDLARRDFTINALAIRLDKDSDHVVDFFGGQRDLKDGIVRVLHTLSFVEDPTRCLRAVRFEKRYGFHLSKNTEKLVKNAASLKVLDRLDHQRIFYEFRQICHEPNPVACILRLEELGILKELFPKTNLSKSKARLLEQIRKFIVWYQMLYQPESLHPWVLYLWGLNHNLSFAEAKLNLQKLHLSRQQLDYILQKRVQMRYLSQKIIKWAQSQAKDRPQNSVIFKFLQGSDINCVLYIMANNHDEFLSKCLSHYVTHCRKAQADIRGQDLIELGLKPGPLYHEILDRVLCAKLDGLVQDKDSQLALAIEIAKKAKATFKTE